MAVRRPNRGVWPRLRAHLQAQPDLSAVRLDSTIGRAHVSAAGAPKKKEADLRGRSLRLRVTGGQRHDRTQAQAWVEDGTDAPLPCLIADRAYDRDGFRAWWAQRGIEAVIPARRGRTHPQPHDPEKYKARNAVARGIGGLKPWRRVATRYDKHAQRFLGFLYLAAAWLWLKP